MEQAIDTTANDSTWTSLHIGKAALCIGRVKWEESSNSALATEEHQTEPLMRDQEAHLQLPDKERTTTVRQIPSGTKSGAMGEVFSMCCTEVRSGHEEWDEQPLVQGLHSLNTPSVVSETNFGHTMPNKATQAAQGLMALDKFRGAMQRRPEAVAEAREAWPSAKVHPLPAPLLQTSGSCTQKLPDKPYNARAGWRLKVTTAMTRLGLLRRAAIACTEAKRAANDSPQRMVTYSSVTARLQAQRVACKALWNWHETAGLPAETYVWNCLELVMLAEHPRRVEVCYTVIPCELCHVSYVL
jgi:hypothetical protein